MAKILGLHFAKEGLRALTARSSFGRLEPGEYVEIPYRAPETQGWDVSAGGAVPPASPVAVAAADEATETDALRSNDPRRLALEELFASIEAPDQIYVDFAGRDASLRTIELPAGAAKKGRIGEVLPFELDDLVPFDIDIALVDYQPIKTDGDIVSVLATAVPRERISTRIDELLELGISPRGMPVGAAALDGLTSFVPDLAMGGPHLILEMESDVTEVCVLENGACTFARSLPFGLQALSGNAARPMAMLRRTLGAYRAGGGQPPERAYLAGAAVQYAAQLSPLLAGLGEGLAFEPAPVPAAKGADHAPSRFARAAALAGRATLKGKRLDMRQGEFAQKRAMGELRQHARVFTIGIAAVLLCFVYATYARYSVLSADNEALQAQLSETTEQIFGEGTPNVERARSLLERGRQIQDPLPTIDGYDVLELITAAIPAEIEHKTRRLNIEIDDEAREGKVDIQGTVSTISDRDTIAANLEAHECVIDVDKKGTSPGPNNEGLNYRLELDLRCPGDEPAEPESRSSRRRRN